MDGWMDGRIDRLFSATVAVFGDSVDRALLVKHQPSIPLPSFQSPKRLSESLCLSLEVLKWYCLYIGPRDSVLYDTKHLACNQKLTSTSPSAERNQTEN